MGTLDGRRFLTELSDLLARFEVELVQEVSRTLPKKRLRLKLAERLNVWHIEGDLMRRYYG